MRRSLAAGVLVAGMAMLLSGCKLGGPEVSASARCDGPAFTSDRMPSAAPQTLILVELSRNDEDARQAIVQAIDPVVGSAVVDGGVVRLLVGGGEKQPVAVSPCLDGSAAILVDRNNDETERRARETAVDAIEGDVSDLLAEVKIGDKGDLSNLLAMSTSELQSLATAEGTTAGAPALVLVVSDLTSPAPDGDCLDVGDIEIKQNVVDAVVARCLREGYFRRLPSGVGLRIVRPQLTPGDNTGVQMGAFLTKSLCKQLPGDGSECASSPVGKG